MQAVQFRWRAVRFGICEVNLSAERDAAKKVIESVRTVGWWLLTNDLKFR